MEGVLRWKYPVPPDGYAVQLCGFGVAIALINQIGEYEEGTVTAAHCSRGLPPEAEIHVYGTNRTPFGVSVWNAGALGVDAQYIRKTAASVNLGVGLIGRPKTENTTGQAVFDLDKTNLYFEIIGAGVPVVGEVAHKVGITTGWTSGRIVATCVDISYLDSPTSRCLGRALYDSAYKDSGSPVFTLDQDGNATVLGIHEAGAGDHIAAFARIDRTVTKLFYDRGITDVWLSRDPPPMLTNIDITSTPISGDTYQPGETIELTYTFSEDVTLYPGLPPRVVFAAPGPRYLSTHYHPERSFRAGEDKLVFTWEVPNDMQGGIWNGPKVPDNRASIGDLAGNRLVANQLNQPSSTKIGPKAGRPRMEKGAFSTAPVEGDRYQPGETIYVVTTWDRPVKVDTDHPPYVLVFMNSTPDGVRAEYDHRLSERWGNRTVAFSYEVQVGDEDDDKLWLGNRNDGTTSLGNAAGITYSGRPASDTWSPASYSRYGAETPSGAPAVSSAGFVFQYRDGQPVIEQYQPGESVEFRIRFDRPVKVDESNPPWVNLSINSGGPARADYDATRTAANVCRCSG